MLLYDSYYYIDSNWHLCANRTLLEVGTPKKNYQELLVDPLVARLIQVSILNHF